MACIYFSILLVLIALCIFILPGQLLSAAELAETVPTQSGAAANAKKTNPTEVIIIGVLHDGHNSNPRYSLDELRKILLALKPAVICVELYSKFMNPDGTVKEEIISSPGCPEVKTIDETARTLGIRQIPFDREGRNEYYKETNYFERTERANEQASEWFKQLSADHPESLDLKIAQLPIGESQSSLNLLASPEIINSAAYDSVVRAKHSLVYEIFPTVLEKYPQYAEAGTDLRFIRDVWHERNQIMADNIARIASQFPGKRIVVTTGSEHRYILRDLLSKKPNIVLKEYWEEQSE